MAEPEARVRPVTTDARIVSKPRMPKNFEIVKVCEE